MNLQTFTPGKYIDADLLRAEIRTNTVITAICHDVEFFPDTQYLKVYFVTEPAAAELTELSTLVTNHDATKYTDLRIYPYVADRRGEMIENVDFTTVGLTKASPWYDKGRKVSASYYTDISEAEEVVHKTFTDWYEDEDDGQGGTVSVWKGLDMQFDWKDTAGDTKISKSEKKPLNTTEQGDMKSKRRRRQISSLVERAKGTPAEPLVDAIFQHYAVQTAEYKELGTSVLEDAINAETDPTISAYLAIVVGMPGDPNATIKDSILYEIT